MQNECNVEVPRETGDQSPKSSQRAVPAKASIKLISKPKVKIVYFFSVLVHSYTIYDGVHGSGTISYHSSKAMTFRNRMDFRSFVLVWNVHGTDNREKSLQSGLPLNVSLQEAKHSVGPMPFQIMH